MGKESRAMLARCCTGVLSSSFVVALGDTKASLTNSGVWVYFSFFTAAQHGGKIMQV